MWGFKSAPRVEARYDALGGRLSSRPRANVVAAAPPNIRKYHGISGSKTIANRTTSHIKSEIKRSRLPDGLCAIALNFVEHLLPLACCTTARAPFNVRKRSVK
jgi:hypothetical protein